MNDKNKTQKSSLSDAAQQWQTTFDAMNDWVAVVDLDGKILRTNKVVEEITGIPREQAENKICCDLLHGSSNKIPGCPLKKMRSSGKRETMEIPAKNGDRWHQVMIEPMKDKKGKLTGAVHIVRDISEHRQAIEENRKQMAELVLINSLNNAINRGQSLTKIINLLSDGLKKIFSCQAVTIYFFSYDNKYLVMQNLAIRSSLINRIEKLIGIEIPAIKIPLKTGSLYKKALQSCEPQLINDPALIQDLIAEFTGTVHLGSERLRRKLKKLVPQIFRVLRIKSVINVPLISEQKAIGIIDISNTEFFTKSDVERLKIFAKQLTGIIKRKWTEQALKESEHRLNETEKISKVGGWEINLITGKGGWTREVYHIYEVPLDYQASPEKGIQFYPEEVRPKIENAFRRLIETGEPFDLELPFITAKNNKRWVRTTARANKESGKIVRVFGNIMDITERKETELALKESEENFRALAENANDGIMIVVGNGDLVFANKQAAEITGYSVAELLKTNIKDLVHTNDLKIVMERYRRKLEAKPSPKQYEFRSHRKDGKIVPVEITIAKTVWKDKDADIIIFRDITLRKRQEQKLRESEEKYHLIGENTKDLIAITGLDRKFVYASPSYKQLGYNHIELIGTDSFKLIHPEDKKGLSFLLKQAIRRIYKKGETQKIEFRHRDKKGKYHYMESISKLIRDDSGKYLILSVVRDITERKQAEEELKDERNKLMSILSAMGSGVTIRDLDYNIIYHNDFIGRLNLGKIIGKKCYHVFAGEEKICAGCPVELAYKDGKSHTSIREMTLSSGEIAHWENIANPIKDSRGKITSCVVINVNVTEQQQAVRALQESEERYRRIFNRSNDGIISVNPENGTIINFNDRFCSMLGYNKEELKNIALKDIETNETPEEIKRHIEVILTKGNDTFESRYRRKDGGKVDVEVSVSSFKHQGRHLILFIIRDVTERKQMEEQLRYSKKMEIIGQLAAGIAHQLNTPLAVISTRLQILQDDFEKLGNSDKIEKINISLKNLEKMSLTVNGLLNFSRKSEIHKEPININTIIKELLLFVEEEARKSRIIIKKILQEKLPSIKADRHQLEQVFLNIVMNAFDIMPDGGVLFVHTNLFNEAGKSFIQTSFSDTGAGISEEILSKIFEPFFTTKAAGEGNGLGLSVAQRIINEHHGEIRVERKEGKGSTFRVLLPVNIGKDH